ncbi:CSLREA domain-containing protein [Pseudomonas sp. SO81]|uniref:CSLREA domain-containing protein n=1 Tax=Pseudomonas sp. SO81 TaxID=2983246 RepID=UPI0025A3955C|nr:CSLREA domain-containing protein [Pseudomonas sp. SO81]WJN61268.1 hypothetical protein OH686_21175 [Pseudomonas sp. SO81]
MHNLLKFQYRSVALTCVLSFCMGASLSHAATFVVSKPTDSLDGACDSDCSLREAVVAANALPGGDTIVLGVDTYSLTLPTDKHEEEPFPTDEEDNLNGDLDVHDSLTIVGVDPQSSIINGTAEASDRLLEVFAGVKLVLQNVSLSNGKTWRYGGALENHGQALLRSVVFSGNTAWSGDADGGGGGAISNSGVLEVHSSRFENNRNGSSCCAGLGGAILNWRSGTLTVRDTLFLSNWAYDDNEAGLGGAIYNEGIATVGGSSFLYNHGNEGAAINNSRNGDLKVFNSTFSGNAMQHFQSATIVNGSFPQYPGVVARLQLVNVTITRSSGGYGLLNSGSTLIRNSIIAGNMGETPGTYLECSNGGSFSYKAVGLLLGTGTSPSNCTADSLVDSASAISTVFYQLADNNGTTPTHALRRNSPAIDAGVGSCASVDQRGLRRPREGNGDGLAVCDLGAYERAYP